MRIEGLHIDGFGHFHERRFMPLAPGMNVFLGPNEAGKSTLLAFIQAMLYGFPRQHRAAHYPPLDGGIHGGRLWIADEQGRAYIVDRHAASRGKDLVITLPDRSETSSEDVLRQLLAGASKDVFTSVFSFGIAELQAIESLSGGEIGSQIYSAGIGAGAVPAALATLARQEEELFRKRGQKHRVSGILDELDEVESMLRASHENDARYATFERERTAVLAECETLAHDLAAMQASASRAARLREALPVWNRAERLRRDLDALGGVTVKPGAVARLESLETALGQSELSFESETRAAAEAQSQLAGITVDESMLGAGSHIEQLRSRLESYAASERDLPKRKVELQAAERGLEEALAEMGPGWSVERAARLDTSNARRIAISELQDRLNGATRECERETARLETARERYDERRREHRRVAAELAGAEPAASVSTATGDLEQLQACLDLREAAAALGHRRSWRALAIGAAAGLAAGAATGSALAGATGAAVGGSISALTGLLLIARWPDQRQQQASAGFRNALASAGVNEHALTAALRRAESGLQRARELERLARAEAEAAAALADADSALRRSAEQWETAADAATALSHEWEAQTVELALDAGTTPALAIHLLAQARLVGERSRVVADAEHRVRAIGNDIDEYRDLLQVALAACGGDPATLAGTALETARVFIVEFDEAAGAARERANARRAVIAAESRVADAAGRVAQHREALTALLTQNDATDGDDLRRRAAIAEERETLARELHGCEIRLSESSAIGLEPHRFETELRNTDPDQLELRAVEFVATAETLTAERDRLLERRGSIERALADLRAGTGTSSLLLKRERLRSELEATVERWCRLRLARRLIERTRGIYEAERQPQVVKAAESYFAAMTGGRYTSVIAPLGEQVLRVSEEGRPAKTPEQLSRGTREQLYLALRFGLIDQFAERGGALPVAVDEVLVNFDPERAREAARGFARLSRRHQVIAFTCHPWVVDLFRQADPNSRVWELGPGPAVHALAGSATA